MKIINNTALSLLIIKREISMINLHKIFKEHNGEYDYHFVVENKRYVAHFKYYEDKCVVDYE